jgi:hypothetical protein
MSREVEEEGRFAPTRVNGAVNDVRAAPTGVAVYVRKAGVSRPVASADIPIRAARAGNPSAGNP